MMADALQGLTKRTGYHLQRLPERLVKDKQRDTIPLSGGLWLERVVRLRSSNGRLALPSGVYSVTICRCPRCIDVLGVTCFLALSLSHSSVSR